MSKLTQKQQLFVSEYLVDLNATQAAIRAGYAEKSARITASKMLTKANIQTAIHEAFESRIERVELTSDWVIEKLVSNVERSMTAEAVYDHEGNSTGEYTYQGNVANKALELLGKHLGMFRDAPQTVIVPTQNGGASLADDIRNIDDHIEELEAGVAEMEAREGIL